MSATDQYNNKEQKEDMSCANKFIVYENLQIPKILPVM